jgi:putative intracellular protease/amidase
MRGICPPYGRPSKDGTGRFYTHSVVSPCHSVIRTGRAITNDDSSLHAACWPSIAIDVKNGGGLYVDGLVVEDGNLITSRKPDDVPAFSEAIIRALSRVQV